MGASCGSADDGTISFVRIGGALGRRSFARAETSKIVPTDLILHDGEMRICSGSLVKVATHYIWEVMQGKFWFEERKTLRKGFVVFVRLKLDEQVQVACCGTYQFHQKQGMDKPPSFHVLRHWLALAASAKTG